MPRALRKSAVPHWPKVSSRRSSGTACNWAIVSNAQSFQRRVGHFADSGNAPHGERCEKGFFAAGGNPHQSARLGLIARDFRNQARGAESAGAWQAGCGGNFPQAACARRRVGPVQAFGAGKIEIGFVNRSHFHDRRIFSRESWRRDRSIGRRDRGGHREKPHAGTISRRCAAASRNERRICALRSSRR